MFHVVYTMTELRLDDEYDLGNAAGDMEMAYIYIYIYIHIYVTVKRIVAIIYYIFTTRYYTALELLWCLQGPASLLVS